MSLLHVKNIEKPYVRSLSNSLRCVQEGRGEICIEAALTAVNQSAAMATNTIWVSDEDKDMNR